MRSTCNIFSILLLLPLFSLGQGVNEARSNFDQFNFKLALEEFQKVNETKSNGLDYDDAEKLAYCYYIVGDTSGLDFVTKLSEKKSLKPHLFLWKGSLEKDAGLYEDAINSLTTFQEFNTETDVSKLIESCRLIPSWKNEWRTSSLVDSVSFKTANSKLLLNNQEFFLFEQELGQEQLILSVDTVNPIVPISKLYTNTESGFKMIETINHENLSIGSLARYPNSDSILFSAAYVSIENDQGNFPQIFTGHLNNDNGTIDDIELWKFGKSETISYSHPTISPDGKSVVYVEMVHGQTSDLKIIESNSGIWGEAKLIAGVNTAGNEMFPNFNSDSILTYSSDGMPGYGGLDLFKVRRIEGVIDTISTHFKAPINSSRDDFQLFWKDSLSGFLTSNRVGGIGDDDIWSVLIEPIPDPIPPDGFPEWHAQWHGEKVYFPYKMDTTELPEKFVEGYLKYAEYYELEMAIVGHTDSRGTSESNFDLAKRRALWLKSKFENTSIKMSTLTIVSKGESTLIKDKRYNEEEHRTNRFVELIISYKKEKQ